MIERDEELSRWQAEWQSLGGRDRWVAELADRVRRDGRRIRRGIARDIGAASLSTLLSIGLLARSRGELVTVVVCAAILVFNGVWVTRLLTLRRGPPAADASLDAYVALTRQRQEDAVRWVGFAARSTWVLAIGLVPWAIWAFVARYPLYRAEPWRAGVGFGGAAVILGATFAWLRWKRRRLLDEQARFEATVRDRTIS